jgi:ABC-type phosphate/phosphonate transport system substrate-binding protein
MLRRLVPAAIAALCLTSLPGESAGATEIKILVLKEQGVGSASQAQPFVDKFVKIAKEKNGWAAASGVYHTDRKAAEKMLDTDKPQFAFLSLPAYLALKDARKLETIGQVQVSRAGGQQYFLVSKSASDAAGCKGAKLATDLAGDAKFVDRVVSGGAFKLADFTVEATKRPLQGAKMVVKDEAKCALVDDAVLADLGSMEGGKDLKTVWTSEKLPPMAVVAVGDVDKGLRDGFKKSLSSLCDGDGKPVCGEIGIQSLKPATDDAYSQILAAYKKDK